MNVSDLWGVGYNLITKTYVARCELCDWNGRFTDTEQESQGALERHLEEAAHRKRVAAFRYLFRPQR